MIELWDRETRCAFLDVLLAVWERAVRSTHKFLQEEDILALRPVVQEALLEVPRLAVYLEEGKAAGFLGAAGEKIEMLFIDVTAQGKGCGRALVEYAVANWHSIYVDVNEQNEQAAGFYRHMGFVVKHRSALDEQGNPFPVLHLALANGLA